VSYHHGYTQEFTFATPITTGTGDTTLVAAPGAGRRLRVQALTVCVTTAAAQAFDLEDTSGTVEVFKAPASLAVGTYAVDMGRQGVPLTTNEALVFNTAAAGVGATISGFGWIQEGIA
jgi:hypothetical protein